MELRCNPHPLRTECPLAIAQRTHHENFLPQSSFARLHLRCRGASPTKVATAVQVFFTPAGKGPFPALIVIHERWGLNDWVKEQASKLADQGYAALAVDLYRGKVATTPDMAHEIMRGVPDDRAKRDLHAAFEFLASQPNVKKDRIGSIGWCMGGGYSLDVALQEPTLAAAVINYGHLATDTDALKKINAPILGLFGAQDRGIPPADVKAWITRFGT